MSTVASERKPTLLVVDDTPDNLALMTGLAVLVCAAAAVEYVMLRANES